MNKILIALVLAVVMSGNAFSSENYISTSLNEQMFVQCLKDASPNISQEAMNRCGYEKRSRSHMGVWKKKNPWFNRHFGDIWDWNNFLSMRNSNKSHGFNIILNEINMRNLTFFKSKQISVRFVHTTIFPTFLNV